MLAAVDIGQLFELLWAAALAGIVVATSFAAAMVGFTRAAESRRDGDGRPASLYGLMGFAGLAVFLGAVIFGVLVIISK